MSRKNVPVAKISPDDFINQPEVLVCIKQLKERFNTENPLVVSDVVNEDGTLQYVDLVQKGGGVLGVALAGYVYVLEEMGIRFLRLAGTSAGAINTALMTVIDDQVSTTNLDSASAICNKDSKKTRRVLEIICGLNFFDLVDGHPIARLAIHAFVGKSAASEKAKTTQTTDRPKKKKTVKPTSNPIATFLRRAVLILVLLLLADFIFSGLIRRSWGDHTSWTLSLITRFLYVVTGIYILAVSIAGSYISSLLRRLKNAGFGVNPGDFFYNWLKDQFNNYGIDTTQKLIDKSRLLPAGMRIRPEKAAIHPQGITGLSGDVVFITSELVTQNKFELPRMSNLFGAENSAKIHPAGFVRASMAIPVFFESYYVRDIPYNSSVSAAWQAVFPQCEAPPELRFVDGGILSNFPLSLFFNPSVSTPRLPTFGIDLDDSDPDARPDDPETWSIASYLGRMLNTIRFYYDKDFQQKNEVLRKGIGTVKLAGFNWLNFGMETAEKQALFLRGVQAATAFLTGKKDTQEPMEDGPAKASFGPEIEFTPSGGFDWIDFQAERKTVYNEGKAKMAAPLAGDIKPQK